MANVQFTQVANTIIKDKKTSSNEKVIYMYLLSLYNDVKKCSYSSIETISKEVNISITTVKKSIKNLVKLGYMKIEKEKRWIFL